MSTFDYVRVSYTTLKEKLKEELANEAVFQDYDFEGSNLGVLLDLLCYFSEMGIYYVSKAANENFLDTAKLYENLHRISTMLGYSPRGYESSKVDGILTLSPSAFSGVLVTVYGTKTNGDIPVWQTDQIDSETDGSVSYTMTRNFYGIVPSSGEIPISLSQGTVSEFNFTGKDLVNGKLYITLPSLVYGYCTKWDSDQWEDINDSTLTYYDGASATSGWKEEPVKVYVYNGDSEPTSNDKWLRVENFQQVTDNSSKYRFYINKYKRYTLEFDPVNGTVPQESKRIKVKILKTYGDRGRVVANSITLPSDQFVYRHDTEQYVSNSLLSLSTSSSVGGYEPEDEEEIRANLPAYHSSQNRCVTKEDYKNKFDTRADVFKANIWSEADKNVPDVDKLNYIYVSLMPNYTTVQGLAGSNLVSVSASQGFYNISGYSAGWRKTLRRYILPFQEMNTYISFVLPDVVHLYFDIQVKISKSSGYPKAQVRTTIKDKIDRFFKDETRTKFNMIFRSYDLISYLMDTDVNETDTEDEIVNSISYITIKNIRSSIKIQEYNSDDSFPMWETSYEGSQNELRNVIFGFNQIPVLESISTTVEVV